jgi:hypothetical protein
MKSEIPLACSLSPGDYRERLEQIREIGRQVLIAADDRGEGVRLVFADDPGVQADLAGIVEAEAACCPFLDLELGHGPEGIWLTIEAPTEAAPLVSDLVASFRAARS